LQDNENGASGEESDIDDELIEVYASEWMAGLDGDDLLRLYNRFAPCSRCLLLSL
jgi:hypothetical protein